MDADLALVIGLVIGTFSIPAIVSAFSEGRAPRVAALTMIVAGALILYALTNKPGGYRIEDIPYAVVRVVGKYIN